MVGGISQLTLDTFNLGRPVKVITTEGAGKYINHYGSKSVIKDKTPPETLEVLSRLYNIEDELKHYQAEVVKLNEQDILIRA